MMTTDDLRTHLTGWAKQHKVKLTDNTGEDRPKHLRSFVLKKAGWLIEVVPCENGKHDWAMLHGRGDLNSIGTTVMSTDEFDEAVERLWAKQKTDEEERKRRNKQCPV